MLRWAQYQRRYVYAMQVDVDGVPMVRLTGLSSYGHFSLFLSILYRRRYARRLSLGARPPLSSEVLGAPRVLAARLGSAAIDKVDELVDVECTFRADLGSGGTVG